MVGCKSTLHFVSNIFRSLQRHRLPCRPYPEYSSSVTTSVAREMSDSEVTLQNDENPPERQGVISRTFLGSSNLEKMGYKLTLNTEETVATVTMPGLSVEDFDRDGNPRITSLMHVAVCMRFFANHKPLDKSGRTFCDYAKLTNDSYSFMASVAIETDQGMYDRTVSKWPLSFQFQIGYVGKSSLSSIGTLTAPSTGQKLMHIITQVVYINKATRRPMPLPDWWRGKYANVAISNEPLIVQRTARPADTHVFKVTVMWTDTDNYNHTTWTSYVQFCINAMHDGIKKGFYKNVSKEVVQRGLQKIRMGFTGENLEGDELIVHSWESAEDNTAVCFEIENTDGEVVFHTMLGYPSILARI